MSKQEALLSINHLDASTMADATSLPYTTVGNVDDINFIPPSSTGDALNARTSTAPSALASASMSGPDGDRASTV
jgi:hypothetical protein